MLPSQKIALLQVLSSDHVLRTELFYETLEECGDLKVGDQVYVEGKMAGQIGRVEELNYLFKIKLSDYWRVIAERGHKYYLKNRVRYICLDCGVGYSQYKTPQNRC